MIVWGFMNKSFSNLTGKVLIASPYTMEGHVFYKSLIYIVYHGNEGAVGMIFNHLIKSTPAKSILRKVKLSDHIIDEFDFKIHLGGPIDPERGFFLHTTSEYNKNLLFKIKGSDLAISSNIQILTDIANGKGPKDNMFIIGYTGWVGGQVELELEHNLWIVCEADHNLIFSNDIKNKWDTALHKLGIYNSHYNPNIGHC